jgi:integrase/recombinase XerD
MLKIVNPAIPEVPGIVSYFSPYSFFSTSIHRLGHPDTFACEYSNSINSTLLTEFFQYMKSNGASESHQNNNLKALISFAHFLGPNVSFYDIKQNDMIKSFLDIKIKSLDEDPDKKWIITWNDYLGRIKYFMRWLHNYRVNSASIYQSDWITSAFVRIKEKKTDYS